MASLKRGNGRAVPLGLRDRPPNTHARVVGDLGPSLMAAAANRPPGASVLPQGFHYH